MKPLSIGVPVFLLVCVGCSPRLRTLPSQTAPVRAEVISLSSAMTPQTLALSGVVTARTAADISSQITAQVSGLRVREGQSVSKGEVLVQLSSVPLAAALQQADAQLAVARQQEVAAQTQKSLAAATFARYDILNQRHSVTPHEFDQVKARLEAAGAQQEAAAAQVQAAEAATVGSRATNAYTVIRAPFSGIVTAKYASTGSMATPGAALLHIEAAGEREVDIQVNESTVRKLRIGGSVAVSMQATDSPIVARIREIVPAGDPTAHTFTVKVGLPLGSTSYTGMTASVALPMGEQTSLSIPKSSVRAHGQLDFVLALDDASTAQLRYVSLGHSIGGKVEVISGLNPGDRILAQPNDALVGHTIEPLP